MSFFRRPKKDKRLKDSILSPWRFALYFAVIGFGVSVSFLLFFSGSLFEGGGIPVLIPEGTVKERALRTLFNILFICFFMTVVDGIRKRIFNHRPVTRILDALSKITHGDFSVKIKPLHKRRAFNEYDLIIEDINKMAHELSSIETLKTDFISNVSHEIKTPLAVIQSYTVMISMSSSRSVSIISSFSSQSFSKMRRACRNCSVRLNFLFSGKIF